MEIRQRLEGQHEQAEGPHRLLPIHLRDGPTGDCQGAKAPVQLSHSQFLIIPRPMLVGLSVFPRVVTDRDIPAFADRALGSRREPIRPEF